MVTPKSDGHAKVRRSAPKSDGLVPIRTPKSDGDGKTPSVTSRHDDVMENVELAIQNQQDGSNRLSRRSIYDTF